MSIEIDGQKGVNPWAKTSLKARESALKRIEEKHKPVKFTPSDKVIVDICPVCLLLPPCDMVKLARALERLSENDTCGCDDHLSADCCATVVPGDCPTCEAERTLEEVAGE